MLISIRYEATNELLEKYPKVEKCLKCGTCSVIRGQSCHVMYDKKQFTPTKTFVYDCFTAEEPTKNPNIWLCVSCHKCEEICPYGISPTEVIESLKEAAFEQGFTPHLIQEEVEQLLSTGLAFPIFPATNNRRTKLGLSPVKKTGVEELTKIAKETGLKRKLAQLKGE